MSTGTKDKTRDSGDRISRFKIINKLGSGGMGVVYKAHDPRLDKTVGLKVLKAEGLTDERQMRFQMEAKALKDLNHANIPKIYNFAISEKGEPYIVLEYVQGTSLKQRLSEPSEISISCLKHIMLSICEPLAYAHSHGIIHRDIKPDNIILIDSEDEHSKVKLIDFGLAKLEDELGENQDMTRTGYIIGSPPYMSPEQIRGKKTNAQSDIYSLGCVLYEMLAGSPPFLGDSPLETIAKHLEQPVEDSLARLPENIKDTIIFSIIEKCLQKNPQQRYDSINDLQTDLENIDEGTIEPTNESIGREKVDTTHEDKPSKPAIKTLAISIFFAVLIPGSIYFYLNSLEYVKPPQHKTDPLTSTAATGTWKEIESLSNQTSHYRAGIKNKDGDFKLLLNKKRVAEITCTDSDYITGSGLADIKELPIKSINLSSTRLENIAVENASLFPNLESLYIADTKNISADAFLGLGKLRFFNNLGFVHSQIRPNTILNISKLEGLEHLSLNTSKPISDEDFQNLVNLKRLKSLQLNGTGIAPHSLRSHLKNMPNLKELWVESLDLTDKDVQFLSALPLSTIDLSGNPITSKSLDYLSKSTGLKRIGLLLCTKIPEEDKIKFQSKMFEKNECKVFLEAPFDLFDSTEYPFDFWDPKDPLLAKYWLLVKKQKTKESFSDWKKTYLKMRNKVKNNHKPNIQLDKM